MSSLTAGCGSSGGDHPPDGPPPPGSHTIGGTVTGLIGSGLTLALDGGTPLAVAVGGAFSFDEPLEAGASYVVTVAQQPSSPSQECVVTNGSGTVGDVDVTDVSIACTTRSFTVSVTVSGLTGANLVLQLNGADPTPFSADGTATFPTALASGQPYDVRVRSAPRFPNQRCSIASARGFVGDANVSLAVTCAARSDLAVGGSHSCVVKTDGTLWCWGDNTSGQLGDGTLVSRGAPVQIGSATTWAQVAAGAVHTCAVRLDGTLWCWGGNGGGQLGDGTVVLPGYRPPTPTPTQVGTDTTWTSVAAGAYHTCATKSGGALWCWGLNTAGELLIGTTGERTSPVESLLSGVAAVATGNEHSCALLTTGALICAGASHNGQLGFVANLQYTPVGLGTGTYLSVSAGGGNTCAIGMDGRLSCWGFGIGAWNGSSPIVGAETSWETSVGGGTAGQTCATRLDGTLWCWGRNDSYQLGTGTTTNATSPVQVGAGTIWIAAGTGGGHSCALTSAGSVWCWGTNGPGNLGIGVVANKDVPTQITTNVASASTAESHACAIRTNGTLWCWGGNYVGQLGLGTTAAQQLPTQVGTGTSWAFVSAGGGDQASHTCAITTAGALYCWGRNNTGQVGDGTTTLRNVPTQVGSATTWAKVAAGELRTCATRTDGTLWCWGNGQTTPLQVGSATTWSKVAVGATQVCGVQTDGTLWCWGGNSNGELGDGTTTPHAAPAQVGSATTWATVAAGRVYTCATRTDGTLWCWGYNGNHQLGDGSATQRESPTQIGSATTWASVRTANDHTCGTRTNGSLWCWGDNSGGELGDPLLASAASPTQIGADLTWSAVSTAGTTTLYVASTCGLRTDATLWCWGNNGYGQLGDGSVWRPTPTQVY